MSRATAEWVGKTDDTAIPPRVKDRIVKRCGGRCQECRREFDGREKPQFDHIVALINGGANAEFNLQPLCRPCHGMKTKADVAEKSHVYTRRATHMGFHAPKRKWGSKGFSKSKPQNSASRSIARRSEVGL